MLTMFTERIHKLVRENKVMPMVVIYFNPTDAPNQYVARIFENEKPSVVAIIRDTYEEILKEIPEFMVKMPRSLGDQKQIVETWI